MNFNRIKRLFKRSILTFSLLFISAAGIFAERSEFTDKIPVGENFYYWPCNAQSSLRDAVMNYDKFVKLEDRSTKNLKNLFGTEGHFVWIRAEFTVPDSMKGQSLGLVIPYLRFAEMAWLNGTFIGSHGKFPPYEKSTLYMSHFFSFPPAVLNQTGNNTLMIKVWSHGQSAISTYAFIKPSQYAFNENEMINYMHSKVYMPFEGCLFSVTILFFLLYIFRRKQKENRDLAFINLFTIFFLIPFFAPELPWYTHNFISYLMFMKVLLCIPFYWMFYFITEFIIDFEKSSQPKFIRIIRFSVTWGQTIITLLLPDYDMLMKSTVPMLLITIAQLGTGLYIFVRNVFTKDKRRIALYQLTIFSPVLVTILIDLIIRVADKTKVFTFITIFGWQVTIVAFMIVISVRYALTYQQNEKLTEHLQEEVDIRTMELKDANYELSVLNDNLEREKTRAEIDFEMASIVQQKFFPEPYKEFKGWDIAICYEPLLKVSGDMYDYYSFASELNGFSLFDVSGHGISASLITMLAKNIISRNFQASYRSKEEITELLLKINRQIIEEKGNIDNYLTGILCRFSQFDRNDAVKVELGNAGHPYPYLYSAKEEKLVCLEPGEGQPHCGAIGMQGVLVAFPVVKFNMYDKDVLVCFTDGLSETVNSQREEFGRTRIEHIIRENHSKSAKEICRALRDALALFSGDVPRDDDLSIIVLKRKSSSIPVSGTEIEELSASSD